MNIGTDPPQHITDIGQGIDTLRQVFGESTTVDVAPRTTGLNMHLSSVTLPMLVLGHVTFGAELALRGQAAAYHVATLRAGRLQTTWEDGQQRTSEAGSVAVFNAGETCRGRFSTDFTELTLTIHKPVLVERLEALLDRSVNGHLAFDRHLEPHRTWRDVLSLLVHQANSADELLSHPLTIEHLQQLLIEGLLLSQRHSHSHILAEGRRAGPTVVGRAIEVMREHPEFPWSIAMLAREVAVSARALHRAFDHADLPPPMTYLRELRLQRVHDELAHADPSAVTVASIARRFGFVHLGRFAAQYRRQFGYGPADTLRSTIM